MKPTTLIILTFALCCFSAINLSAQNKASINSETNAYLKGLVKAGDIDLIDKEIEFDGESFPVYTTEGKRVRGNIMMELLMSNKYIPDFYMDKEKEIRAAVLRLVSDEEQKMMLEMNAQMMGERDLIGSDAPDFAATDINGNKYSLSSLKGKIIVMNFWFVECKPCIQEIPDLNKLVEDYKNEDVVFLGFATNEKSKIDSFLKKKSFSYNIIPDSKKIAVKYQVTGYPTHIVIDKNSRIAFFTSGLSPITVDSIDQTIKSLVKK
jgi:peroxiredoxin